MKEKNLKPEKTALESLTEWLGDHKIDFEKYRNQEYESEIFKSLTPEQLRRVSSVNLLRNPTGSFLK